MPTHSITCTLLQLACNNWSISSENSENLVHIISNETEVKWTNKSQCVTRGATMAEKLRGRRFGSQHRGTCTPRPAKGWAGFWVREGVAPSRCECLGVSFPENFWKLRSCILVTNCCEISCFWKTMAKKLGGPIHCWSPNLKVWGTRLPGPYGCCAYVCDPEYTTAMKVSRLLTAGQELWFISGVKAEITQCQQSRNFKTFMSTRRILNEQGQRIYSNIRL